jgi:hypothetical protein
MLKTAVSARNEFCHRVAEIVERVLAEKQYPVDFRGRARNLALSLAADYHGKRHPVGKVAGIAITQIQWEFAEDCRWRLEDLLSKSGHPDRLEQALRIIATEAYTVSAERSIELVVALVADMLTQ